MKTLITLFSLLIIRIAIAQDIVSSPTYIETCLENKQCVAMENSGYLFYDQSKNALYLKVNFKTREDSSVYWLSDLSDDNLYFKVVVPDDFFKGTTNYNQREFKLNGKVYLNGAWQQQTIDLLLLSSENSIASLDKRTNTFDDYKVNFSIAILPADFNLNVHPEFTEILYVALLSGRINPLLPGMEVALGAAYNAGEN